MGRDLYLNTPSVIQSADNKNTFLYKTCESGWSMTPEIFSHSGIKGATYDYDGFLDKSDTAYWMEDGKVKYSFNNAVITMNKNDKHADHDGWDLTWTSEEVCNSGT